MDREFNQGMYSDKKIAQEWCDWVESFKDDETRSREIYPFLTQWLKSLKPGKILEIGSGQGECSKELNLHDDYIGIEPSMYLREVASELYPGRDFRSGTAEQIPLPDKSVDAIFSVFVWLHIYDLKRAAEELRRVLKDKGHFCIVTANPETYDLWFSWHNNLKISGKEARGDMKKLSNHVFFTHTLDEISASLVRVGLNVTQTTTFGKKHSDPGFAIALCGEAK